MAVHDTARRQHTQQAAAVARQPWRREDVSSAASVSDFQVCYVVLASLLCHAGPTLHSFLIGLSRTQGIIYMVTG